MPHLSGFETLDLDAALTLSSAQFANMNTMNLSSNWNANFEPGGTGLILLVLPLMQAT